MPALARLAVPGVTASSPVFVAGLSMGGFGALRIGAKYPKLFRAVSGHSSITEFEQMRSFVVDSLGTYMASAEDRSVADTMLRHRGRLPAIRFDCGTEDPLIEANRELHRTLQSAGIEHEYAEFPGGHDWPYWQEHLADSLRFFARQLDHTE